MGDVIQRDLPAMSGEDKFVAMVRGVALLILSGSYEHDGTLYMPPERLNEGHADGPGSIGHERRASARVRARSRCAWWDGSDAAAVPPNRLE